MEVPQEDNPQNPDEGSASSSKLPEERRPEVSSILRKGSQKRSSDVQGEPGKDECFAEACGSGGKKKKSNGPAASAAAQAIEADLADAAAACASSPQPAGKPKAKKLSKSSARGANGKKLSKATSDAALTLPSTSCLDLGEETPADQQSDHGISGSASQLTPSRPSRPSAALKKAVKGRVRFTYNMAMGVTKSDVIPKEEVFEFTVDHSSDLSCWEPLGCVVFSDPGPPRQGRMLWQYMGNHAIAIRALPEVNGPRTRGMIFEKEVFWVKEERVGDDDQLLLRLSDGRGWIFAYALRGEPLCVRIEVPLANLQSGWVLWQFNPPSKDIMLRLRTEPDRDSEATGECLEPADLFWASEERKGADGINYLRLPNNQGWAFERRKRAPCFALWDSTTCCVRIPMEVRASSMRDSDSCDSAELGSWASDYETVDVKWHFARLKLNAVLKMTKTPERQSRATE
mmetsp:Transcript_81682/g.236803  ORF Transcript_81682/g.236803 Transcript_81682/m.236803 type:complete len:458 (+) Transcript_81682:154-1527(+)|eukprot:CAMPEP_0176067118 /NCGR_PEP_ID=MMETSP0120_2-20121206/33499_1 /TAXON_ID=160619 /ORGANISM="Kryptoperidinium foliaceum, Strain CCMP 1326" /LENGTH=457 /DNA_ID=CAMNT_0017400731 /DNA_START=154 /DNA_END=1527 /DNA_ORIENTATION=+